jgi:O-antigen/teichoic acid export membrane protein
LISVFASFIVPKVLDVEQFGYWQLYIFYVGYVGFFHFGVADGIYLRYGGEFYDELDKSLMNSQIWILSILEFLVFLGFLVFALLVIKDESKKFIVMITGLNCIIMLPRTLLQYILQTTGRIQEYARNFMLERVIYIVLVLIFLVSGVRRFEYMMMADVGAKIIALIGVLILCKDIVFSKLIKLSAGISEFWKNISSGSKLMFANIAGMLIIGIVRFGIERTWDIVTFGKVSFSLNISAFVLTFINAVSVVIFPMIKRSDQSRLPVVFETLGIVLSAAIMVLLIAYYPLQKLLLLWLPHYEEAIRYFAILFPIVLFESRTSLLNNTYLKALREERMMLYLNVLAVGISLITTVVIVGVFKNLILAIVSIVGLQMVKCILPEFYLQKKMGMKRSYDVYWSVAATCVFIYGNWVIGGVLGWGIYVAFIAMMFLVKNQKYREQIKHVKSILGIS